MVANATLALEHLESREVDALRLLIRRLVDECGDVCQILLFGSKARGDDTEDSDIDVLVIAERENWEQRDHISLIASEVDLEYDVVLNVFLISESRWRQMSEERFSLCRNVERDGILLYRREGFSKLQRR